MPKPVAVVTGGSRGIGRAIVEELSGTHTVVATYNTNQAAAQAVAESTGAVLLHCQLASPESCSTFAKELSERCPQVDCW